MIFQFGLNSENLLIDYFLVPRCVLLLLLALAKGTYNRYLHPLAGVLGPFWGSVTKLYLAYMISSVPIEGLKLHQKNGELCCSKKSPFFSADIMQKALSCD